MPLERKDWRYDLSHDKVVNEFKHLQAEEGLSPLQAARKIDLPREALLYFFPYLELIDKF